MSNIRNFLAMAIVGVGLALTHCLPASAQSNTYGYGAPGAYGWSGYSGSGGYGYPVSWFFPITYWGAGRYLYRPGGLFDVGWEGSGYGSGNNWGYNEVTPSRRIAPPVVTLRPPA